ncbi:hypothetical protein RhiirA4_476472 [Rhizophagus irregularis]|uniref:Uncharacterized protein n=1 Tax=Rhizophagus irregularis TaxID=588596 RepID=A0A2I1HBN4_9GLOM|nr:hypothetical protein RhiirA4_476472 [Rhizophagus irregularis]
MEPIDDFGVWNLEVSDRTYQRFWNSEVLDRTYQRFWNSEILEFGGSGWNLSMILKFGGPGRRNAALDFIFEGSDSHSSSIHIHGSSVLDFGDEGSSVPRLWRQRVLRFLDFEDDGFSVLDLETTGSLILGLSVSIRLSTIRTGIRLESQFEGLQHSWKEFQK